MLQTPSLFRCAILSSLLMAGSTALACGDLKCPFTGKPPNYECPPKFKDIDFDTSGVVTLQLTGMTVGGQAGQTSCQAAVIAPFGLLTPRAVRMLDANTGQAIRGFGTFQPDSRVTAAHYPGLGLASKYFVGFNPPNAFMLPTGFFTRLTEDVPEGVPMTMEIDFLVSPNSAVTSNAVAQMMTGNVRVSLGEAGADGRPQGHTTWMIVNELERPHK